MAKLPAIQFYPGDWLLDSIAGCSLAAQGLWLRMMFIAHNSDRYGYLMLDGKPLSPEAIARRCGCSLEQYLPLLAELDGASIPSRTKAGVIFSRRMVRDAEKRADNRMYQFTHRKSLARKGNSKTDVSPMSDVSSTSSSSLNTNTKATTPQAAFSLPDWVPSKQWNAWLEMRKKKRAAPTEHAKALAVAKLQSLREKGHDPGEVLDEAILRNWTGIFEPSSGLFAANGANRNRAAPNDAWMVSQSPGMTEEEALEIRNRIDAKQGLLA